MAETAPINQSQPEVLVSVDPSTLVSEEVPYTDDPTFPQRAAEQRLAESTYNAKARADAQLRQMTQAKSDSSGGWAMLVLWPFALGGCEKKDDWPHDDYDGDGVLNEVDKCEWEEGSLKNNGCPDSDGDGVIDDEDDCPTQEGTSDFNGCPDSDGDGIGDHDDECPNVKGEYEFQGCPDSDEDGTGDQHDECPNVWGTASDGCLDNDYDGVSNQKDECPNKDGPEDNNGCPKPNSGTGGSPEPTPDPDLGEGFTPNSVQPPCNDFLPGLSIGSEWVQDGYGAAASSYSDYFCLSQFGSPCPTNAAISPEGIGINQADYLLVIGLKISQDTTAVISCGPLDVFPMVAWVMGDDGAGRCRQVSSQDFWYGSVEEIGIPAPEREGQPYYFSAAAQEPFSCTIQVH